MGGGLKTRHFNVFDVFDVVAKLFLLPDAIRMPSYLNVFDVFDVWFFLFPFMHTPPTRL